MKCSKCGNEFEGNFCPECGAPKDSSPQLQEASAPPTDKATVPSFIVKLYAHMPKVFSILFAVFAVVMLICYAGPVTKSELLEEFGESDSVYYYISESGEESAGSFEDELALSSEDDIDLGEEDGSSISIESVCAALVAFGVISVAFAAIGLAFAFSVPLAALKFKVGDRTVKVKSIFDIVGLLLLFAIFLLGCILCANVGDDLGMFEPGAAPICVIFFSLFFGLLMVLALFGRKLVSLVWRGADDEYEAQKEAARAKLEIPLEPLSLQWGMPILRPITYISDAEKEELAKFVKRRNMIAYITLLPFTLIVGSIIAFVKCAKLKAEKFWRVYKTAAVVGAIVITVLEMFPLIGMALELTPVLLFTDGTGIEPELMNAIMRSAIEWGIVFVFGFVMMILNSINLTKSKKYMKQYYGVTNIKRVQDYPQYLQAVREYRKDSYNYFVDMAYYDEGVARRRRA